jgi:hypothetical protein
MYDIPEAYDPSSFRAVLELMQRVMKRFTQRTKKDDDYL